MKSDKITFDIETRFTISKDTAEVALKLVEMYCNANGVTVHGYLDGSGEERLCFTSNSDYFKKRE